MIHLRRAIVVLSVLCLLPLAAALLSALLAALLGCELSETGSQACSVLGLDVGGFLSSLFVAGWMALIAIPVLMGILALWALVEGAAAWRRRRREHKAAPGEQQRP